MRITHSCEPFVSLAGLQRSVRTVYISLVHVVLNDSSFFSPCKIMAKKKTRRRQNDPGIEDSNSSDNEAPVKGSPNCTHLAKAINLPLLRKSLKEVRLSVCAQCTNESSLSRDGPPASVEDPPTSTPGVMEDEPDKPLKNKSSVEESSASSNPLWVCLQCGYCGCGGISDKSHSLLHYRTPRSSSHALFVDTQTWSGYCLDCNQEIDSSVSARLTECIQLIRKAAGMGALTIESKPKPTTNSMTRSVSLSVSIVGTVNGTENKEAPIVNGDSDSKAKDLVESLPSVKGLSNLGNTCFFNSVMQVLSQTHLLTQLLDIHCQDGQVLRLAGSAKTNQCGDSGRSTPSTLSSLSTKDQNDLPPLELVLEGGRPLSLALASFLKEMHCPAAKHKNSSVVTPSNLFSQISRKNPQFRGFDQQDSHELLRHLLDNLKSEEILRYRHALLKHYNLPKNVVASTVDPKVKAEVKAYGKQASHTLVDKLFGGVSLSAITCTVCNTTYPRLESFMDLSLPLADDKPPPPGHRRKQEEGNVDCFGRSPSKTESKKAKRDAKRKTTEPINASQTDENLFDSKIEESDRSSGDLSEADVEDNLESEDKKSGSDASVVEVQLQKLSINKDGDEQSISSSGHGSQESSEEEDLSRERMMKKSQWAMAALEPLVPKLMIHGSAADTSLYSCLQRFTAPELLTGSNKYGCEECTRRAAASASSNGQGDKKKTATVYNVASLRLLILAPPALLTLHVKRFMQSGFELKKSQKHINFPTVLDLASFTSIAAPMCPTKIGHGQTKVLYSLYGVVEHKGRLSSGHYTAFVKVRPLNPGLSQFLQVEQLTNASSDTLCQQSWSRGSSSPVNDEPGKDDLPSDGAGKWYHISDTSVRSVTLDTVLKAQAYLLFYERIC